MKTHLIDERLSGLTLCNKNINKNTLLSDNPTCIICWHRMEKIIKGGKIK